MKKTLFDAQTSDDVFKSYEDGANPNSKNIFRKTALEIACENGNLDVFRALVKIGADYGLNDKGYHPINLAIRQGFINIVIEYIEVLNFDVNMEILPSITSLMLCCSSGYIDILDYLLAQKNIDLEITGTMKRTALFYAFINKPKNSIDVLNRLINSGCNTNATDRYGRSPLFYAKTTQELDYLLFGGVNINIIDIYGNNALLNAVLNGDHDYVEALLHYGCDPSNTFAFETVIKINNLELLKLFLRYGAKSNNNANEILYQACENNNTEAVKLLLESGIYPDNNQHNVYPIYTAIDHNNKYIVKLLLEYGADPNPPVYEFRRNRHYLYTPLMRAVRSNVDIQIIIDLLEYCADIEQKDRHNLNVIDYAESIGDYNLANFFKEVLKKLTG